MANDTKLKSLLSDLGRATLRGIRKCPKCGTFNGTRGLCCKNKACNVVFKEAGEKRKLTTEACRLVTGTTTQVFSVRVRDKGPDYRGFVQLPVVQHSLESDNILDNESTLITQTSALCFVDTCQRSFDASVLKCHEKSAPMNVTVCQHIQAALRCYMEAIPLTLKNCVLSNLNVSNDIKQSIWDLASESSGPIVQRVSKSIMAVKCKASPKHPLGYLHFSFLMTKFKERVENKYFCSCTAFKGQVKHAANKDDPTFKKCVHFYACICAFASDPKLSEEFAYYINLDRPVVIPATLATSEDDEQHHLVAILSDGDGMPCEVEVKVIGGNSALLNASTISMSDDSLGQVHTFEVLPSDPLEVKVQSIDAVEGLTFSESTLPTDSGSLLEQLLTVKRKREEQQQTSTTLLTLVEQTGPSVVVGKKGNGPRKNLLGLPAKKQETTDENTAGLPFISWLASVTERINQTMHFQFSGKPEPLTFLIPQVFFDCLRERISCGGKKKRLPNQTTAFRRKDSAPTGQFTKYTWHITNIIQVKQIFETPLVPLEITRSFVQNHDGTYEPYQHHSDENELFRKTNNQPLIKPLELKTYLKVGNTSPDQLEPTPFVIEWIPDIFPVTKTGELRISFEFGHQNYGPNEKRQPQRQLSKVQPLGEETFIVKLA